MRPVDRNPVGVFYCPSAAIDVVVRVSEFEYGTVNRAVTAATFAGGKGVVAARAATRLGAESALVTYAGGAGGEYFLALLSEDVLRAHVIRTPGETRVNVAIQDDSDQRTTVINSPSLSSPGEDQLRECEGLLADILVPGSVLVISGSVPEGLPSGHLSRVIEACRSREVMCIVDSDDRGIAAGLAAGADVVRINAREAAAFLGAQPIDAQLELPVADQVGNARNAGRQLVAMGAGNAVIGIGRASCVVVNEHTELWIATRAVRALVTFGGGDSFVAGLTARLLLGDSLQDAAQYACSVAAASLATLRPGDVDPGAISEFLRESTVEVLS